MLSGRWKHLGKGLLKARPDARLIAQFRQFIGYQIAIKGKYIHQSAHVGEGRLVAPDLIQPLGDGKTDTHTAHQYQPTYPVRIFDR